MAANAGLATATGLAGLPAFGPDYQLTQLQFLTAPAWNDVLAMVDVSDTSTAPANAYGSSKKVTFGQVFATVYPSGDTSGLTDTVALANALSQVPVSGGVVNLTAGNFYILPNSIVISRSGVYLNGAGNWATYLHGTGTGDVLRFYDASAYGARTVHGGGAARMTIDGASATGASSGLHAGDIFQFRVDVTVQNFTGTGASGVHFDNCYYWTEQMIARVFAQNCTTNILFDVNGGVAATGLHVNATGSYERGNYDFYVNQGTSSFDCVSLSNGAFWRDNIASVHGNVGTSTTALSSAALRITGSTPSGVTSASISNIGNSHVDIGVECDTSSGANAPYTVYFGSGTNTMSYNTGNLDFGAALAMQSSNNSNQFVQFVGVVQGDANLPGILPAGATNIADTALTVSSTTATAIPNITAQVASYTAYRVRIYVPYSSTKTAGTPVVTFSGPAWALASFNWHYQTAASPYTTAPTVSASAPTMTGPTLTTAAGLALLGDGVLVFSSAGTLGLNVACSVAADTWTVALGAYLEVLPLAAA